MQTIAQTSKRIGAGVIHPSLRDVRDQVLTRDGHRCRWCGRAAPVDAHHIRYRRGITDDTLDNLISLCRGCHEFVHGAPTPSGSTIAKAEAQEILFMLIELPGMTGLALRRQRRRRRDDQLE